VQAIDQLPLLDRIHTDALQVLGQVGVNCENTEIRSIFEATGMAAYDETTGHLYVLPPLVEQALTTMPKRDQYWIPENSFGIGGTAPFVHNDTTGELLQPTFEHLTDICKIAEKSNEVAFMGRGVLIPKQEVKVMELMTEYFSKPVYMAAVTEAGIAKAEDIHNTRGNITIPFSIINSPLNIIESMIPPFLSCVRKGIPTYVSTMPMAGLSAPYSTSGLLTLTHAEALFGITLAQLVNPGVTIVHAGLPSIANINKNYSVDMGLASHNVANLLLDHVNKKLNLPSIHSACTTNEDHPGVNAEADAAKGYAVMKKYGFHQMRHAFGFLKELVSFSPEKLIRHIEICKDTTSDQAPDLLFDPYDPEGFDAISRNSSKPNYMRDNHTLKNMEKYFLD